MRDLIYVVGKREFTSHTLATAESERTKMPIDIKLKAVDQLPAGNAERYAKVKRVFAKKS